VEEVEADNVIGREHGERAAEHEQDEAEVSGAGFHFLNDGLEAGREADDRGHGEERRRDAI